MVEIVPVTKDNIDELLVLIQKLAEFEKLEGPDSGAKERLLSHLGEYVEAYLAMDANKPVGYLILCYMYSSFRAQPMLFVEDVFVDKEVRGKGVGKVLLSFAYERAKQKKCCRIDGYVLDWNTNAQKVYETLGAKKTNWLVYRFGEENF